MLLCRCFIKWYSLMNRKWIDRKGQLPSVNTGQPVSLTASCRGLCIGVDNRVMPARRS